MYPSQNLHQPPTPTVSDILEKDFVMYGGSKSRRDSDLRSEENYFVNPLLLNKSGTMKAEHSSASKVSAVDKLSQLRMKYPVPTLVL